MKQFYSLLIVFLTIFSGLSQTFNRSELSTPVSTPWEILYGSDNFIWVTESGGRVSRVNPSNGDKTVVYTAPDYFGGSSIFSFSRIPQQIL